MKKFVVGLIVVIAVAGVLAISFIQREGAPSESADSSENVSLGPITKAGTLEQNENWSGEILVTETVTVPAGVTLTIEPGTVVKFKHYRGYKDIEGKAGLKVQGGTLKAAGTPENQIWFTSDAEDPINGDWSGIHLVGTDNCVLDYVIVEFGDVGILTGSNIISNSIIRWNNSEGLYTEGSSPIYENNTLYGNAYHEISLEQYNENVQILNNIIRDGNNGIIFEKTSALVKGNYFENEAHEAIIAGKQSDIIVKRNRFENIGWDPPIAVETGSTAKIENNDYGAGTIPIPEFDYEDTKKSELGYIPGDPEKDRYPYVFDNVDETRRVVKKIGEHFSFGWALTYAENHLWRFSLGGTEKGKLLDFIRINPNTGDYQKYGNDKIINPRGLAHDGEYFWVKDFTLEKIFKFKLSGNSIEILDNFDIPETGSGMKGLTTDGDFLYLSSADGFKLYKLDKSGNIVDNIYLEPGGVVSPLVRTENYFWITGSGKGLGKFTTDGNLIGSIYPAAEGTMALAWDGNYLWTIQRTCEMWGDNKIYQIEILDDSSV